MFAYNVALFIIFTCIFQILSTHQQTTHYFSTIGSTHTIVKVITVALFSMAGIPPFYGFFTKMFLFQLLCMTNFSILYPLFFTILFLGLYFYIQNVRFLNNSNTSDFTHIYDQNMRSVPLFFSTVFLLCFLLLTGYILMDDLLLVTR